MSGFPSTGEFCALPIPLPMPSSTNHPKTQAEIRDEPAGTSQPATELIGVQVLAIDDDPVALQALQSHLKKRGCKVLTAANGREGLEQVNDDISVALIDMCMPELNGLDCLKYLNQHHPNIKVIIVTASADIANAVEAMREGAFQYVVKPFNPESLAVQVQKAYEARQIACENKGLREVLSFPEMPAKLVSEKTDCSAELLASVSRISQLDSTVYIGGETGTGKTTIARMIHQISPRGNGPFIAINCASLPRELIESELFGHARGAFTGAINDRIGKAEVANGGTLFLDEIGDLPIELQPKLLTFLQDRVIQRVGCNVVRPVDVRLVVATHRDLGQMCRDNRFRQDLYYRLNVLSLHLSPLRERVEDISQIAHSVVHSICRRQERNVVNLAAATIELLKSHPWPGNIRELENVLERAIAFSDRQEIVPTDLIFDFDAADRIKSLSHSENVTLDSLAGKTLEEIEIQAILETLQANDGNKAKSARMLGISEKSIYNKMKRLGINYPPEK